jgi:hypothetical protein
MSGRDLTFLKESKGKNVEQIMLNNIFWENANKVLQMGGPIVDVFHMVDGAKPCMNFVYEGMDRRWKMMHHPLRAMACYLDPRLFGVRHQEEELMSGLYEAIDKLNPDPSIATLVGSQLKGIHVRRDIWNQGSKV